MSLGPYLGHPRALLWETHRSAPSARPPLRHAIGTPFILSPALL